MAYVTAIYGGSAEQVDYRLAEQHGCDETQFGYHVDLRERPLEWIGSGLEEFGLVAGQELTAEQFEIARALIAGRDPFTGAQLVAGKQAIYDDAKLPGMALVDAVHAVANAAHTTPAELLAAVNLDHAKRFARLERAVATHGAAALLRADHAGAIARAAGLDPDAVWGPGVHAQAVANLTETVVGADGQLVVQPRRLDVGIKAFDLSITLPKSLSILLAVAPEDTAAQIENVYRGAVGRVFGWTEARTSYVLRGQHGDGHTATRQPSSGFLGWVMVHRTARPVNGAPVGDPHWHVHITVANMVRGADGTWSTTAAGGRDLMRHAAVIDKLTQAEIRRVLHAQFGIEFARSPRTGLWEVAAIPDATIRLFSKRGQQVRDVLAELGYAPGEASAAEERLRTRTSRTAKDHTTAASDTTLREHWHAQLATNPHQPNPFHLAYAALNPNPHQQQAGVSMDAIAAALAHPETGLTATRRRFSRLDALARIADELPYGGDIATVEAITDTVLQRPLFQRITTTAHPTVAGAGPLGARHMTDPQLYTTSDIPAAERTILNHAHSTSRSTAQVPNETTRLAVATVEQDQGFALSAEQRTVVETVCASSRPGEAVVGPAGTGKTTVMRAARVAWQAAGHTVAGAATAAVAAQNLHTESGIPAATVAQWQHRITHGPGLTGVDVLVLDEANLTDDRARAQLYTAAATTGTRIVEIGDPKQLRGVGAGSMFGYLHHTLDGPSLTENRRQHDPAARATLAQHRAGNYTEALHSLAQRGQLLATETPEQATAALVAAYLQRAAGAPDPHTLARGLVVLAATTEHVDRLNDTIQAARHRNHHTGPGHTYPAPRPTGHIHIRLGDHVLLRRNDRAHLPGGNPRPDRQVQGDTVLNGYRGIATAVTPYGVRVAWQTPTGNLETAEVSPAYIAAGGLDLGYALTTHKAEGLTIGATWTHPDGTPHRGDVLIYGPGMDQANQYVALSRPRGEVLLVGNRHDLEPQDSLAELQHATPTTPDHLTARVTNALAHHATTTAHNPNDQPVLVDLGQAPTQHTRQARNQRADADNFTEAVADRHEHPAAEAAIAPAQEQAEPADEHHDAQITAQEARRWEQRSTHDGNADYFARHLGDRVPQQLHDLLQAARHGNVDAAQRRELDQHLATINQHWAGRPHAHLPSDTLYQQLQQAITDRDHAAAALPQLREHAATLEARLAAGPGPREQIHRDKMADLEARATTAAELAKAADQAASVKSLVTSNTKAVAYYQERLDQTPWYKPGNRRRVEERLTQAQHAAAKAAADHAPLDEHYQHLKNQAQATHGTIPGMDDQRAWYHAGLDARIDRDLAQDKDRQAAHTARRQLNDTTHRHNEARALVKSAAAELALRDQWAPQHAHAERLDRITHAANQQLHQAEGAERDKQHRTQERSHLERMRLNRIIDQNLNTSHNHAQGHGLGL